MTKLAICYWGMTRSTRYVYGSHETHVFNVLKQNNIDYDVYIHTWKTDNNIIWEHDCGIENDYDEYKLLHPDFYGIDNQADFLNTICFPDYFNEELYNKYGGDTHHEWRPYLIKNHLCALESQKRVTNMMLSSNIKYDYVMYIRPDVEIHNPINIEWLNINDCQIVLPDNEHHEGYNDRFAIVCYQDCHKYGKRIEEIIDFRKNNGRIVSEKYVKFIINKYFNNIRFVNFRFTIIRPH